MNVDLARNVLIEGGNDARLSIEGAALRIDHAHAAPVWIPLRRAARVYLRGRVALAPDVIETLSLHAIALIWLHRDGTLIGSLLPNLSGQNLSDAARIDLLLQRPDWRRSYQHWRHRQAIWDAHRVLGNHAHLPAKDAHAAALLHAHRRFPEHDPRRQLFDRCRGWLRAEVTELLAHQGWPHHRIWQPQPGPNPALDLLAAASWELLARILDDPPTNPPNEPMLWFSRHVAALRVRAELSLTAFRRWLNDQIHDLDP